jgi:hypothetical protein
MKNGIPKTQIIPVLKVLTKPLSRPPFGLVRVFYVDDYSCALIHALEVIGITDVLPAVVGIVDSVADLVGHRVVKFIVAELESRTDCS